MRREYGAGMEKTRQKARSASLSLAPRE